MRDPRAPRRERVRHELTIEEMHARLANLESIRIGSVSDPGRVRVSPLPDRTGGLARPLNYVEIRASRLNGLAILGRKVARDDVQVPAQEARQRNVGVV